MTQEHPITPPPELVKEWMTEIWPEDTFAWVAASDLHIATQAARWGADQELEACCKWLDFHYPNVGITQLRAARRPKPPSLKEQALEALDQADEGLSESKWQQRSDIIRRALESLPD